MPFPVYQQMLREDSVALRTAGRKLLEDERAMVEAYIKACMGALIRVASRS